MKTYVVNLLLTPGSGFALVLLGLSSTALWILTRDKDAVDGFMCAILVVVPASTLIGSRRSQMSGRRKAVHFWVALTMIAFICLLICYFFDQIQGNADRLIRGIAYQNVLMIWLWLNMAGLLVSIGLTSRQKNIQNISLMVVSGLVFLLVFESIGHLIFELKLIKTQPFTYHRFYLPLKTAKIKPFPAGDMNPVAGRSHVPNGSDKFTNCKGDTLHWTYNSVGANDRQRQVINPNPNKKRIAIMGDSFLEGYMVNTADRWSSILERKTGLEHLNFAVNGSNPVHYYLMYKGVAKSFGADVVIIGFLPANDFEMLDEHYAYNRVEYPQYTPYWQGTYPHYRLRYSLANVNQSIFHGTNTQASLLNVVDSVYASLSIVDKVKADVLTHSSLLRLMGELDAKKYRDGQVTKYQQFSEEEWHYVSYSLTKLAEEAKNKKVLILSIPTRDDIKALKEGKTNRIDPLLANFCRQKSISFIPLASSFLAYKGNLADLYVTCDGHWSAEGESFVANTLIRNSVYRSLVGLL